MRRLALILGLLAPLLISPALAEDFVNSGAATKNAPGVVLLCQTTASLYLPCNATTPLATTGGGGGGGAVTVADGADVAQGAVADAACATDNGTCTEIALLKRNNQRLTTLNTTLGTPIQATGGTVGLAAGAAVIGAVTQSGTWNVTNISGTVSLPTGASTSANQTSQITQETATAAALGTTADSACASDTATCSVIAMQKRQAQTLTTISTNVAVTATAATASSTIMPNNTTAIVVKASAGTIYNVTAFNNSNTIAYIKFYNATSATAGSGTPVARSMIPANTAGTGLAVSITAGSAYSVGITYIVTTGIADNDNTAPAANAYIVNVHYR